VDISNYEYRYTIFTYVEIRQMQDNVLQHLRNSFQSTFPQQCDFSHLYLHNRTSVSNVVVNLAANKPFISNYSIR